MRSDLHPLHRARTAAGLSLRRLADKSKVHFTRLHYAEHGLELREDELLRVVQHDPKGDEHTPHAFVFGDAVGGKVADPKKSWAAAVKAAGITDLHFHDLRHEAGSRFVEQGWPLHHVREMLGHADLKTTDTYINTTRQGLHDSMKKFGTPSLQSVAKQPNQELQPPCNDADDSAAKPLVN